MSCSGNARLGGRAELTFACRGGRTVLADSRIAAPMALVRPFDLPDGRQLVQLITLGPGFCGGDRVRIRITADAGAGVVVTTTAATRVLSMQPGAQAAQDVDIIASGGATIEYYPAVTIPFPESAFAQAVRIHASAGARVGVLETWALGRTARGEYLQFRSLSNRTTVYADGEPVYVDATDLRPDSSALDGAAVLAGRRYLSTGVWFGATLAGAPAAEPRRDGLLAVLAQSRPGLVYLRALADDASGLDAVLRRAAARIAAGWDLAPVPLDRFRC